MCYVCVLACRYCVLVCVSGCRLCVCVGQTGGTVFVGYEELFVCKTGGSVCVCVSDIWRCGVYKGRLYLTFGCTGALPRKLYVQMDNCWRENKNKYVFAYMSDLVVKGVFDEVTVSFLIKGHTHFDPDQVFSRVATKLKVTDALDVTSFKQALKEVCFIYLFISLKHSSDICLGWGLVICTSS